MNAIVHVHEKIELSLRFGTGTSDNLGRRERPQVLVIKGEPAVLFTGASMDRLGGMSHTFTLAQAIATVTPAVELY